MAYQGDTNQPQQETFGLTEFFTKTDEPGCTNIETCQLTTASGTTCETTAPPSGITFDATTKTITAQKDVLVGYSHQLCMKCTIHANLQKATTFTVEQTYGCG